MQSGVRQSGLWQFQNWVRQSDPFSLTSAPFCLAQFASSPDITPLRPYFDPRIVTPIGTHFAKQQLYRDNSIHKLERKGFQLSLGPPCLTAPCLSTLCLTLFTSFNLTLSYLHYFTHNNLTPLHRRTMSPPLCVNAIYITPLCFTLLCLPFVFILGSHHHKFCRPNTFHSSR